MSIYSLSQRLPLNTGLTVNRYKWVHLMYRSRRIVKEIFWIKKYIMKASGAPITGNIDLSVAHHTVLLYTSPLSSDTQSMPILGLVKSIIYPRFKLVHFMSGVTHGWFFSYLTDFSYFPLKRNCRKMEDTFRTFEMECRWFQLFFIDF